MRKRIPRHQEKKRGGEGNEPRTSIAQLELRLATAGADKQKWSKGANDDSDTGDAGGWQNRRVYKKKRRTKEGSRQSTKTGKWVEEGDEAARLAASAVAASECAIGVVRNGPERRDRADAADAASLQVKRRQSER